MAKGKNRQKHSPREARNKRAAGAIDASEKKRERFVARMRAKGAPTAAPTRPPGAVNDLAAAIMQTSFDEGYSAGIEAGAEVIAEVQDAVDRASAAVEASERTTNELRKDLKTKTKQVIELNTRVQALQERVAELHKSGADSVKAHIMNLLFPSPTQGA